MSLPDLLKIYQFEAIFGIPSIRFAPTKTEMFGIYHNASLLKVQATIIDAFCLFSCPEYVALIQNPCPDWNVCLSHAGGHMRQDIFF